MRGIAHDIDQAAQEQADQQLSAQLRGSEHTERDQNAIDKQLFSFLDGHVPLLVEHLTKFIKRECSITNIVTVAQNDSDSSMAMGLSDTLGRIVQD